MNQSKRAVHWNPDAPPAPVFSSAFPPACAAVAPDGLKVASAEAEVTCIRCGKHARGETALPRRARPQLRRIPPEGVSDDGVSRWTTWKGRHWRVWPIPKRDGGWHLEEVTEDGEPAGHVRLGRDANGRREARWVGGHYQHVDTLAHARDAIADLGGNHG